MNVFEGRINNMNTEEIIRLIRQHGLAKDVVKEGDIVLVDGAHSGGEYVTLCRVVGVKDEIATLQEEHTYYLNGGEYPERKISTVPMEYFKKSIPEHIQSGRDVFRQIAEAFQNEE